MKSGRNHNSNPANFSGFVRAKDARLQDADGRDILLRGVGLGNWLLPEGYMWKFGTGAESPREIEELVSRLIGDDAAQAFWREFRDNFISEEDIALIASQGFNHIRLPINSRIVMTDDGHPIDAGFELIDRVIDWCRKYELWVLLDLHGAPGGQTGTNIDDSPNNKPELFMDQKYWKQTVELWRWMAIRYRSETVVLGYDLLNEPIPNEWQHQFADELVHLYRELTSVIRAVDLQHLIVYEGSHWATNWDIFTEVWDSNSMLQFHKYWSPPDTVSIQRFLDVRDRLGLPIYMGEGGENNLEWLYTAFRLYETHAIGWNFWPWKKIDTLTSPLSVQVPLNWERIRDSAHGHRDIQPELAQFIFNELLLNMRVKNCVRRNEVVNAVMAESPKLIPAWGFGFRGFGESYLVKDPSTLSGMRSDDGVTLEYRHEGVHEGNDFGQNDGRNYTEFEEILVSLKANEWVEYEVSQETELGRYELQVTEGDPSSVTMTRTSRGFRLKATEPVKLLRIFSRRP